MTVQQRIIKGIRELLFLNDYLVIPGFGGFVLKTHSSQFTASRLSLLPPSKKLGFNVQLKQNDGLLIAWLQQELNCNLQEAKNHVDEFVQFCNSLLQSKRRLNIEQIGFFYLDFENNICFEPRQDVNFLSDSFGLGPVSVKELNPPEEKVITPLKEVFVDRSPHIAVQEESKPLPKQIKPHRYRRIIFAGFAVFIMLGFLSLLLNIAGTQGALHSTLLISSKKAEYHPIDYTALNIESGKAKRTEVISNARQFAKMVLDEEIVLNVRTSEEPSLKNEIKKERDLFHSKSSSSYEIIFGCFSVRNNAIRFARQLENKNLNVQITRLNDKNLFAVSIGNYSNKEEAKADLNNLKSEFPSVWVKKMP